MQDLKLIAYLVVGALVIVGGLGKLVYNDFFGESDLVVWGPESSDATVSLDGADPVTVPRGERRVLHARPGSHQLVATSAEGTQTSRFKMKAGGFHHVAPTSPRQCFVLIDVGQLFQHSTVLAQARYNPRLRDSFAARIDKRITSPGAIALPKHAWYGLKSLPSSINSRTGTRVVEPYDCNELSAQGDSEVLVRLGASG